MFEFDLYGDRRVRNPMYSFVSDLYIRRYPHIKVYHRPTIYAYIIIYITTSQRHEGFQSPFDRLSCRTDNVVRIDLLFSSHVRAAAFLFRKLMNRLTIAIFLKVCIKMKCIIMNTAIIYTCAVSLPFRFVIKKQCLSSFN